MKKSYLPFFEGLGKVGIFFMLLLLGVGALADFLYSKKSVLSREIPQEREIYNTIPGSTEKKTILDATNPMELMNQLRRATAMDNATSPSDAVDEALRALDLIDTESQNSQLNIQ